MSDKPARKPKIPQLGRTVTYYDENGEPHAAVIVGPSTDGYYNAVVYSATGDAHKTQIAEADCEFYSPTRATPMPPADEPTPAKTDEPS